MPTRPREPRLGERELQRLVIRAARLLGWFAAHFRPARTSHGNWRTPVEGDGAGFLDLVLCKPGRPVLFRELKVDGGQLTVAQLLWLNRLQAAGADAGIWRPEDWRSGRILEELKS